MTLDKKLARLRKKEGLSQAEVSEKLGVSRQAVSRWESGDSKPSTENLQAICRLYNVQMDSLLNDSEGEPLIAISAGKTKESSPEQGGQEKRERWIRLLVIGVAAVALVICCIFWYVKYTNKNNLSLSEIEREDTTSGMPQFDLTLE